MSAKFALGNIGKKDGEGFGGSILPAPGGLKLTATKNEDQGVMGSGIELGN
jgi:hypothetical protein